MAITKLNVQGVSDAIATDLNNVDTALALAGRRNLVINGAMQVWQRGTTSSIGSATFVADRFRTQLSGLGAFTLSQSTDSPDGFYYSSKLLCTTADTSPAADDVLLAGYQFEGQDFQHLQYGTSSAKQLTASFWVKSNKTGTFVCSLLNVLSSPLRKIVKTYTIDTADTWEYKTITFEGDTAYAISNSINRTIDLTFWMGSGSTFSGTATPDGWADNVNAVTLTNQTVNLADAVNNYWQITGIQLEVGDTATDFEHRSFGEELALCQRYYEVVNGFHTPATAYEYYSIPYKTKKRAIPTVVGKTDNLANQNLSVGTVDCLRGYNSVNVIPPWGNLSVDAEL